MKLATKISQGTNAIGAQAGSKGSPRSSWLAYDNMGKTALHTFVRNGRISEIPADLLNLPYCLTRDRQGITVLRDIILKSQLAQVPYLEDDNFRALGHDQQIEWEEALETNGAPDSEISRLKRRSSPAQYDTSPVIS
jgi:hypothetical protein